VVDDVTHVPITRLTDVLDVPILFTIKASCLVKHGVV